LARGLVRQDIPVRQNGAEVMPVIALRKLRPQTLWTAPSGPGWGPLPELLLSLTLVTGLVDAVSILALGRVFVANMTGNVVFAGFAIVGAPGFSLGASLFALAGFLIGAWVGGVLTNRVGHDRALHTRAATGAEFGLVAIALVIAGVSGGAAATTGTLHITARVADFSSGITYVLALVLATAMGIQNSVARKLAVPDLTTTVLTMTLTGIGADARTGRRGHVMLARRVLAVVTMLVGGILGAWLVLDAGVVAPLALATALLAIAVACAALAVRKPGEWRRATPAPAPATPAPAPAQAGESASQAPAGSAAQGPPDQNRAQ
jgi:uncharacterized membrane protein YoaK (UPF0700 family)